VRAEVIDDGRPFDPLGLPDPDVTSSVEDREIGGLGVYLVRKMMDDVIYERRERLNCLIFCKRIGANPGTPTTEDKKRNT
jgi:serine/threonine-protein kinase RsbW